MYCPNTGKTSFPRGPWEAEAELGRKVKVCDLIPTVAIEPWLMGQVQGGQRAQMHCSVPEPTEPGWDCRGNKTAAQPRA